MSDQHLTHRFVEAAPEQLEPGVLYVSVEFAMVMHLCCCGCGSEVVTPLSPKDWKLTFDGESITLYPSIGNWSFPCRSHYWIRHNQIEWAPQWSEQEIRENRQRDLRLKLHCAPPKNVAHPVLPPPSSQDSGQTTLKSSLIRHLFRWIRKS